MNMLLINYIFGFRPAFEKIRLVPLCTEISTSDYHFKFMDLQQHAKKESSTAG